ncbi:MAG TPA: hypothetical protein VEC14_01065 [Reyranellaceae bacterium]|nr:hypothetical protein [Reyranellaceae bacterium]
MKIIQIVAHAEKIIGLGDDGGLYEKCVPLPKEKTGGVRRYEWVPLIEAPAAEPQPENDA